MIGPPDDDRSSGGLNPVVVPASNMLYIASDDDALHSACAVLGLERYVAGGARPITMWREVYAAPNFLNWIQNDLPMIKVSDETQPSPASQLNAELEGFCVGRVLMVARDFHCLIPEPMCVWELKTPDLRLFGWFIKKNWMILHCGEDANKLHGLGFASYRPYIDKVVDFRGSLDPILPGPVVGVKPSDVVSNKAR